MTLLRVHSLHALAYCERLFYLEEVENMRVADERVYAGRRLHVELARAEDEEEWLTFNLESERWGLVGRIDCVRRRDGVIVPYEHKRGRSARSREGEAEAWASDRLQVIAYAALVEEHTGRAVPEGRVRYHADNVLVHVPFDEQARAELARAIERARELQASVERPPVTTNERLCVRCSLAPVCLPEEARLAERLDVPAQEPPTRATLRLFPADDDRRTLHVLTQGARVGRKGDRVEITARDEPTQLHPVHEIGQIVLHGFAQITTQALRLCAEQEIGVHWLTGGGRYMGAWSAGVGSVQRRIRQYRALTDPELCLRLARRLAEARARGQLSFLLRASREVGRDVPAVKDAISGMRKLLSPLARGQRRFAARLRRQHWRLLLQRLAAPRSARSRRSDAPRRAQPTAAA
jgi:CRISPR-associated protein Cas1